MTGNKKYNKNFEIEFSTSEAPSGTASEPPTESATEPPTDSTSGSASGPSDPFSGPKVDESSVMVSGMVPMFIEYEGKPLWISKDLNSKRAFRPERVKYEVSNVMFQYSRKEHSFLSKIT